MSRMATATELLSFCNRVREAGGADPLPALLESLPGSPRACLIARGLNFNCAVYPAWSDESPHGAIGWVMGLDPDLTPEQRDKIAAVCGYPARHEFSDADAWVVDLPPEIGLAARAFDNGDAFKEFVAENA